MHPAAHQRVMSAAAQAHSEALARVEKQVDALVERLDRQERALALLVQDAEARAAERQNSKRSTPKS